MVTLLYGMMILGGAIAFIGGGVLLVFGKQMRARDEAAGRITAKYPTPQAQRRLAIVITAIGLACLLLAFIF
ncbi:hypothetical protein [Sphingomonas endolithica]|jgi:hypothetical protein|uniref:hypothetical protein n=1 Tax=Sphingomonas endolithica TaxID=2972485 RepID=UPI0021AFDEA2|nr:hypothetical protein [Sphingomonas sp. ZFBP2030]